MVTTTNEPPDAEPAEVETTQPPTEEGGAAATTARSPDAAPPYTNRDNAGAPGRPLPRILLGIAVVGLLAIGYAYRASWLAPAGERSVAQTGERKVLYWVDPMHPSYTSDRPGKAPDCGMDLVPVYADGSSGPGSTMPNSAFQVAPERQQLVGVKIGEVAVEQVSRSLRAVGKVSYDETKIVRVHTKVDGWVEKVYADFTGALVRRGQPLIDIYSPDLVQTQQEYLLAIKYRDTLASGAHPEVAAGGASLVEAARRRLQLWDVSDAQIAELERRGTPQKAVTLYAPADGFVITKNVFEKQRITSETELFQIADLSSVWVIADVYENEAGSIAVGQRATVTLEYAPRTQYRGSVSYVYPQVDEATRTVRVRVDVPNADFALKPEMYTNVELQTDFGRRLVVPAEAVLDSGGTKTVFVALGEGYFEPRSVTLGEKVDGKYVVLAGLAPGEKIVTSGNFMLDSESQLKSAGGAMGMPGMDHGGGATGARKGAGAAVQDHSAMKRGESGGSTVDHSKMKHAEAGGAPIDHSQMDHSQMDHSQMDHSKMAPTSAPTVDHSKMDHSKMNHSQPGAGTPAPDRR